MFFGRPMTFESVVRARSECFRQGHVICSFSYLPQVQEPAAQPQLEQVQEVFPQPPAIVICLIWLIERLKSAL
ncbi:hypothetical protein BDV97DRAFT_357025 [Delphinella strobiligena]|nr:hypothetical protein BDV97DRAFT_357025 [Delphinella strobiligena]